MQMKLFISRGKVRAIYDDALSPLFTKGQHTIKRASHVEPACPTGWKADLSPVGGPTLIRSTRSAALKAEVDYLNKTQCKNNS